MKEGRLRYPKSIITESLQKETPTQSVISRLIALPDHCTIVSIFDKILEIMKSGVRELALRPPGNLLRKVPQPARKRP
jgi:hypothetical protein